MPSIYYVVWWNLENLFDEENSLAGRRSCSGRSAPTLQAGHQLGVTGRLSNSRPSSPKMNGGGSPDLLGICEIENRFAVDLLVGALDARLPGRNYTVVHADTDDARGIDVAFVYDPGLFEAPIDEVFFHVVMRRNATRELGQVNFKTHKNRTWSVFGNHWPSRSGGQFESAGYRDIAGETLSYFHQRALEVHTSVCTVGRRGTPPTRVDSG
jgi:Endonuclease/Exonuclease/phosphatase family